MHELDAILFAEDASPEDREALRRALSDDAELRARYARWMTLRHGASSAVDAALPDRRLLVLEGLRRAGGSTYLSAEEVRVLQENEARLSAALRAHPGLQDVVAHVEEDVTAFAEAWEAEMEEAGPATAPAPARRHDRASVPRQRATGARWAWRISAAAAVVAFAFIVNFLVQREAGLETVATGPDQTRQVVLADGSRVRLLPNSTLEYPGHTGPDARFARLRGDGYFEIAPDRSGFTIELPTAVVVVLGTSFGVQSDEAAARIYLDAGRLSVAARSARTSPVLLRPGEMTSVARDSMPEAPVETDVTRALSWTGLLVFRDTPVQHVASVLTETYARPITADARLREETLTATFERTDGLATVLEAVAAALDAHVVMQNGAHHLVPR